MFQALSDSWLQVTSGGNETRVPGSVLAEVFTGHLVRSLSHLLAGCLHHAGVRPAPAAGDWARCVLCSEDRYLLAGEETIWLPILSPFIHSARTPSLRLGMVAHSLPS